MGPGVGARREALPPAAQGERKAGAALCYGLGGSRNAEAQQPSLAAQSWEGATLLTSHQEAAEGPGGLHSHTRGRWSTPRKLHRPLGAASEGPLVRDHAWASAIQRRTLKKKNPFVSYFLGGGVGSHTLRLVGS